MPRTSLRNPCRETIPEGWVKGWKMVTSDREPLCTLLGMAILWFERSNVSFSKIEEYKASAKSTKYLRGETCYAKDVQSGEEFTDLIRLQNRRQELGLDFLSYGPAIHVYLNKPDAITSTCYLCIEVAYHPQEIVHRSPDKVGVLRVKVLT